MAPIRLSYIWYRRLYAALLLISLSYVTLYVLHAFNIQYVPLEVRVELIPAIASALVAVASGVLIFLAKKFTSYVPPLITYGLFLVTTAYVTQSTGGVHSSFLPIWSLLVFVAPIFSAYGWLPVIVMVGSYVAGEYLTNGLPTETLALIGLSSIVPLLGGVIVWREVPGTEDASNRNVKKLANELSEVAAKSEIVINAIGDGVIAVDGKGSIQLINPAAQEILGWGKQDAMTLSYKSVLKLTDSTGKELGGYQDPLQMVLNNNQQARDDEILAVTNSGKKLSLSIVASPIGDPGSGAIAVFRDVTSERAEEREQAEFISTASHEMRTPVASIEGYLGLALNANTATIDARARDFINKAHEAAEHLGRLFQDLLDVSKSEDGRLANQPKVLDVVPFTNTIVQGLSESANAKGLKLTFVPGEGNGTERGIKNLMPVYYVNLDNDHIREVLNNLVENAIKYTPAGEVRVDISGTEDTVQISIKDSGLGIPAEDIPHLFQKFYRVNNMDRQSIGGTGLGLYLCRRLVEAMQGRIWVESEFEKGSTFYVELPRISNQEAEQLKDEQAGQGTQPSQTVTVEPVATKSIAVTFADTVPVAAPQLPQATQPAPIPPEVTIAPPPPPALPPAPAPAAAPSVPPLPQEPMVAPLEPADSGEVKPATTVPRGETLTREQINERVRQLEALAQQQRGAVNPQARQ